MGTAKKPIIIILAFVVYYVASRYFKLVMQQAYSALGNELASYIVTYVLLGTPLVIGTIAVTGKWNIFKSWGLNGNMLTGLLLGIAFTLPMFIGSIIFFSFNNDIYVPYLLKGTILAGLFEEAYFRGFLFGLLFRHTRAGFIISAAMGALIFAFGHLYQSSEATTQAGIFLVTFLGAGFFAWLYVEWQYNLWVPVFLHTFMNLSWMAFDVSDNAMGNSYANIFRVLTIAIAIGTTVFYKIKKGKRFEVNGETMLIRRN